MFYRQKIDAMLDNANDRVLKVIYEILLRIA